MTYNMPGFQPAQTKEEVDTRISLWQDMPDDEYEALGRPSLNDYLGWPEEEYWTWVTKGIIPNE